MNHLKEEKTDKNWTTYHNSI